MLFPFLELMNLGHFYGYHEQPWLNDEIDGSVADNDRHQASPTDQIHCRTKYPENGSTDYGATDHLQGKQPLRVNVH
jgi:hypothetical protein